MRNDGRQAAPKTTTTTPTSASAIRRSLRATIVPEHQPPNQLETRQTKPFSVLVETETQMPKTHTQQALFTRCIFIRFIVLRFSVKNKSKTVVFEIARNARLGPGPTIVWQNVLDSSPGGQATVVFHGQ